MSKVQLEILLGTLLLLATTTLLVIYGVREEVRMAEYEEAQAGELIEVGASLFESNCSGCHGVKGEGILGLCPPLNDRHFFTERVSEVGWAGGLEDYVVATISSGRIASTRPDEYPGTGSPAMPAWHEAYGGPLRGDQVRALAAFVMNWEATAVGEVVLPGPVTQPTEGPGESDDPVVRGQGVFLERGCSGCHLIEGLSVGVVGPELTHIATVAGTRVPDMDAETYLHASIINPSEHIVEGFPDVMPKNFGELISDDELNDLVTFLLSLE